MVVLDIRASKRASEQTVIQAGRQADRNTERTGGRLATDQLGAPLGGAANKSLLSMHSAAPASALVITSIRKSTISVFISSDCARQRASGSAKGARRGEGRLRYAYLRGDGIGRFPTAPRAVAALARQVEEGAGVCARSSPWEPAPWRNLVQRKLVCVCSPQSKIALEGECELSCRLN